MYTIYTPFSISSFPPFFPFPVTNQYPFHNPPPGPQSDLFVLRERRERERGYHRQRGEREGEREESEIFTLNTLFYANPVLNTTLLYLSPHKTAMSSVEGFGLGYSETERLW